MHRAFSQLAQLRPVGLADLAPSNGHRAQKRADEAPEEDRWRHWNGNPGYEQRHQGRPKGLEVDDRRDDDRMRIAQSELEQQQTGHADKKEGSELGIMSFIPQQQNQVAATFFVHNQEWNRHHQGDLGHEHELRHAEPLGRKKRKRLLHRQQKGSDDSVNASKLVVDWAFLRRWRLHFGGPDLRRCNIEGSTLPGPCRSA